MGSAMFETFPKTRPPLPGEIEDIYHSYYKTNREGKTTASWLSQRMESWLHLKVAKDIGNLEKSKRATLELGAGTLNQLYYEPEVYPYDIVEPFADLYKSSPLLGKIRNIYDDISKVPISFCYQRITSIAALEHICNLPEVVARCGLLLAKDGTFRAAIPSEGTLLWTLGWKLTTGLEFKLKYDIDYGLLMMHEHVNTAEEIEEVLNYFFEQVVCNVFGLSKSISLFRFYECRIPKDNKCYEFSKLKVS